MDRMHPPPSTTRKHKLRCISVASPKANHWPSVNKPLNSSIASFLKEEVVPHDSASECALIVSPLNAYPHTDVAQPAVAADRFAPEIGGILTVCAALAAAERQPVRRTSYHVASSICCFQLPS